MSTPHFFTTLVGTPRIGPQRELKKALEKYWAHPQENAKELSLTACKLANTYTDTAEQQGIEIIPTFGRSYYDSMLDITALLGLLPERFNDIPDAESGDLPRYINRYFATARGTDTEPASPLTKWFDTNYHYIVPELSAQSEITLDLDAFLHDLSDAQVRGKSIRPVLVGPVTYLGLAKTTDGTDPFDHINQFAAAYVRIIKKLASINVEWLQLDEPYLVTDLPEGLAEKTREVYTALTTAAHEQGLKLQVQTYFDSADHALEILSGIGIDALGVDLVSDGTLAAADKPASEILPQWSGEEQLIAGVVDGRNIWITDLTKAVTLLEKLAQRGAVTVAPATSLLHVPYGLLYEPSFEADNAPEYAQELKSWLAFGAEKIEEVALLGRVLKNIYTGQEYLEDDKKALQDNKELLEARANSVLTNNTTVQDRVAAITDADRHREPFEVRKAAQDISIPLPNLPTTTIGSFPQTPEIRSARQKFVCGEITDAEYENAIKDTIKEVIDIQEELGLDVLVHGEPERNDMVQYFGEQLEGYYATANAWVQSYGSRCVRPPIIFGDVARKNQLSVEWYTFAQSLTQRPVKGMLTGPVTMLAWSFVRDDQPLGVTADQVGLALRDEVADLVEAGAQIIQVDEPAIRELLPLRKAAQPAYLEWAVGSFRLSTSGVEKTTQIHTHMCYSQFNELIDTIEDLDADVTSIEAARSDLAVVYALKEGGFAQGVGPGVWDIHSLRVPSVEEQLQHIQADLTAVRPDLLWVNPDCGLKTRTWPEVISSLKNLVEATQEARKELTA